jgi:hypothetical protein
MIDMPEFPIRSIYISELMGKEVLAAVGDGWTADI